MKTIKILRELEKIGKEYYTPADMAKITGLTGGALKVRISRLKKAGVIDSSGRGMYTLPGLKTDPEKAANDAVYPSYISFRSALSKYGVISEVPYVLEMATTKPTRRKRIGGVDVLYRKLKKNLFFGYALAKGVFIAEPEKAFLDLLYLKITGKEKDFDPLKMDLTKLDIGKVIKYSAKFPEKVKAAAKKILKKT
jgi:predicted transcriptional regulator of viral defense system